MNNLNIRLETLKDCLWRLPDANIYENKYYCYCAQDDATVPRATNDFRNVVTQSKYHTIVFEKVPDGIVNGLTWRLLKID